MRSKDKAEVDAVLCAVDDQQIAAGLPILSVLVCHDDGAVATAFWTSVKKHKLQLPLESNEACEARLRLAAFAFYKDKQR